MCSLCSCHSINQLQQILHCKLDLQVLAIHVCGLGTCLLFLNMRKVLNNKWEFVWVNVHQHCTRDDLEIVLNPVLNDLIHFGHKIVQLEDSMVNIAKPLLNCKRGPCDGGESNIQQLLKVLQIERKQHFDHRINPSSHSLILLQCK